MIQSVTAVNIHTFPRTNPRRAEVVVPLDSRPFLLANTVRQCFALRVPHPFSLRTTPQNCPITQQGFLWVHVSRESVTHEGLERVAGARRMRASGVSKVDVGFWKWLGFVWLH